MAVTDIYANQATITVTESAANTLTFKKLETGVSLGGKEAWVIHRIEYFSNTPVAALFDGNADQLIVGLSQSSSWSTPSLTEATILEMVAWDRMDFGTAGNAWVWIRPYVKDFAALPAGGLICVPNPLYGFAKGTGLASASTTIIKIFYTTKEVKDQEFYDLWQSRVMLTA